MGSYKNVVAQTYIEISDLKHKETKQVLDYNKKGFTYLKNQFSDEVLTSVSINEIEQLLNTYKNAESGKHNNRCLLKGLYRNGYNGSDCYQNAPYLFFDIDVKNKDEKKENIHLLDKITNEKIFKELQQIAVLCWRSNSRNGMAGLFYVPQIANYLESEKNKHKEAGKAITKYVSEYLYKRTGISKINFDQAQSKFRQVRLLAEQQTPVTLNKAPFEFSYKLITKKREYKKGVTAYRPVNYKRPYGSINQQFDDDNKILDVALNNGFTEVSRSNGQIRVKHENSNSKSSGVIDESQNVYFNFSSSVYQNKTRFTPSDLVLKLQFQDDYSKFKNYLNSLGYKELKKSESDVKRASDDLKAELKKVTDDNEADKIIFSYCYDLQTLEPQQKKKFIKETCKRPELEKYFTAYLGAVDLKINYDKELTINKYVAEVLPEVIDYTNKNKKVIMRAETGKGKTTAIAREFHKYQPNARVLVLEPLTVIIEQNKKEYADRAIFLDGNSVKDKSIRDAADYESLVFATYEQGLRLLKSGSRFDYIIIDEVHQLLTANSFKTDVISELTGLFYDAYLIGLTGTPTNIFKTLGYKIINVDVKKPEPVNVEVRYSNSDPYVIALNHLRNVKDKTLLRLNDIKGLETLKKQLVINGLYKKSEILVLHSTKEVKQSKDFELLAHGRCFDEKIKLVLTTSLIDEGLSINQANFSDVVFIETSYLPRPEPIKQFFARFRNKDNKRKNYLYLRKKIDQTPSRYKPDFVFKEMFKGLKDDSDSFEADEVLTSYNAVFSNDRFYYVDGEINPYYLAYYVTDIFFSTLNSSQFLEYLKTNYNLLGRINTDFDFDKKIMSLNKSERKKIKQLIAFYWINNYDEVLQVLALHTQSKKLKNELIIKQMFIKPALQDFVVNQIKDFENLFNKYNKLFSLGVENPNEVLIKSEIGKEITLNSDLKYKEHLMLLQLEKTVNEPQNAADRRTAMKLSNIVDWCRNKKEFSHKQLFKQINKERLFSRIIKNEKMFFKVLEWYNLSSYKNKKTGLIKCDVKGRSEII